MIIKFYQQSPPRNSLFFTNFAAENKSIGKQVKRYIRTEFKTLLITRWRN